MNHNPSWKRWPPNCCETCVSWNKTATYEYADGWVLESDYIGVCSNAYSMDHGTITDSRYRYQSFKRKAGV